MLATVSLLGFAMPSIEEGCFLASMFSNQFLAYKRFTSRLTCWSDSAAFDIFARAFGSLDIMPIAQWMCLFMAGQSPTWAYETLGPGAQGPSEWAWARGPTLRSGQGPIYDSRTSTCSWLLIYLTYYNSVVNYDIESHSLPLRNTCAVPSKI